MLPPPTLSPRFSHYLRQTPLGFKPGEAISISTQLIICEAEKKGIECDLIPGTRIFTLKFKGITRYFRYQISPNTTDIGFYSCLDKSTTSTLLLAAGLSVPKSYLLTRSDSEKYWLDVFKSFNDRSIVVKPTHGNKGRGITIDVKNETEYLAAVKLAFEEINDLESGVVVEEMVYGDEYRIVATRTKVLAIMRRKPAYVTGNGRDSIEQLIKAENTTHYRTQEYFGLYPPIHIDSDILSILSKQQLVPSSIPKQGQEVNLRSVSNLSQGGESIDVTDEVDPQINEIALKAINALPGIDFVGIDLMTENIKRLKEYAIIEINSSPGIDMHHYPIFGKPRNVASELLTLIFPVLNRYVRPTI